MSDEIFLHLHVIFRQCGVARFPLGLVGRLFPAEYGRTASRPACSANRRFGSGFLSACGQRPYAVSRLSGPGCRGCGFPASPLLLLRALRPMRRNQPGKYRLKRIRGRFGAGVSRSGTATGIRSGPNRGPLRAGSARRALPPRRYLPDFCSCSPVADRSASLLFPAIAAGWGSVFRVGLNGFCATIRSGILPFRLFPAIAAGWGSFFQFWSERRHTPPPGFIHSGSKRRNPIPGGIGLLWLG